MMKKNNLFWNIIEKVMPWLVLFILGTFTYAKFFLIPYTGIIFSGENVRDIISAENGNPTLQIGDRIHQVGPILMDEYLMNPQMKIFEGAKTGDQIPIWLTRNGKKLQVDWVIPGPTMETVLGRITGIWWMAYVFWLAGTVVIVFHRPKNSQWIRLFTFFYLIGIYLGAGSGPSGWHIVWSTTLLKSVAWVAVPIFLQFHWEFPKPLGSLPRIFWRIFFLIGLALAITEWFFILPPKTYLIGFFLALLGSLSFLLLHYFRQPKQRPKLIFFFTGIGLASAPIILIRIINLLGIHPPMLINGAAFLALPMIPSAYFITSYWDQAIFIRTRIKKLFLGFLNGVLAFIGFILLIAFIEGQYNLDSSNPFSKILIITISLLSVIISFIPYLIFSSLSRRDDQTFINAVGTRIRANRFISIIIFSLLVGFILSLVIVPSTLFIKNKLLLTFINFTTALITYIITASWFSKFSQFVEKMVLNINALPADLVETYIEGISSSLDRDSLASLLIESVLPSFLIRTSALVCVDQNLQTYLYIDGIDKEACPPISEIITQTTDQKEYLRHPFKDSEGYDWIQLILPLVVTQRTIGFWCLGNKDPDDIYTLDEIKILKIITNQTAIALANIQQQERVNFLLQENIYRQEEERSKLARDLHDDVLNGLVVLGLSLDDNQISPEFEKHYKSLTGKIRRLINGLRPPSLKHGLWYALEEKTEEMRKLTGNNINIEFNIQKKSERYHPSIEGHLFRIIQQALDNAIQHAVADNILIFGELNPDSITLGVEDDGIGIPPKDEEVRPTKNNNDHYGLTVMQERAELIDGQLKLISAPGQGTRIEIILKDLIHKQDEHQARIRAEESLRKREDSFKELVDSASYGILMVDEQDKLIYANPTAVNILGYSSPELRQFLLKDLTLKDEYQKINNWRQKTRTSESPQPLMEIQVKTKIGEIIQLEMTMGKTLWNGKNAGMLLFNDISAEKQIEEAQRRTEEILYKILEKANEGIVIIDQDGNHLYVNQNYANITGYSTAELIQMSMRDFVARDLKVVRDRLGQRFEGINDPSQYESTIIKKDGGIIPIISLSTRIIWQGQPAVIVFIQDISDLKQAKEALVQSEEKFKTIVENANDGILVADGSGLHIYANSRAAEITGYSIHELIQISMKDLAHPDDFEKIQKRLQSRVADIPITSQFETRILTKSGNPVLIEYTSAKITWSGQPAVIVIIRDISKRKQAENILQNSELKFKAIVDNANDGIFIADHRGNLVFTNQMGADITGYSIEELLSLSFQDLVHPIDLEKTRLRQIARVKGKPVPSHYEVLIVLKDGNTKPIDINFSNLEWNNQTSVLAIVRDISVRRKAENALIQTEENFKAIVNNANDGIMVAIEGGKHIYANARAAEITGYSVEELLNTTVKDLAHPDEYESVINKFNTRISGGKEQRQYMTRIITKSGGDIPVEITAARTRWNQQNAIIVILRDISKLKEK